MGNDKGAISLHRFWSLGTMVGESQSGQSLDQIIFLTYPSFYDI
ncbi:MAG: hypothetical protein AB1797_02140 [bacterium]